MPGYHYLLKRPKKTVIRDILSQRLTKREVIQRAVRELLEYKDGKPDNDPVYVAMQTRFSDLVDYLEETGFNTSLYTKPIEELNDSWLEAEQKSFKSKYEKFHSPLTSVGIISKLKILETARLNLVKLYSLYGKDSPRVIECWEDFLAKRQKIRISRQYAKESEWEKALKKIQYDERLYNGNLERVASGPGKSKPDLSNYFVDSDFGQEENLEDIFAEEST